MTGLRDPDLGNWTYGFDSMGNMLNQTDAKAVITRFTYDGLNRLTQKTYPTDTGITLTYDTGKVGTLSQADSPAGTVKYGYDSRLRLVAENHSIGSNTWSISHAYDTLDRGVNKTFSSGGPITYVYTSGYMPLLSVCVEYLCVSHPGMRFSSQSKDEVLRHLGSLLHEGTVYNLSCDPLRIYFEVRESQKQPHTESDKRLGVRMDLQCRAHYAAYSGDDSRLPYMQVKFPQNVPNLAAGMFTSRT